MLGVWGGVVGGSMRSDISVSGVESFGIDLLALSIDTALNFEQDDIGNWTLDIGHWTMDIGHIFGQKQPVPLYLSTKGFGKLGSHLE